MGSVPKTRSRSSEWWIQSCMAKLAATMASRRRFEKSPISWRSFVSLRAPKERRSSAITRIERAALRAVPSELPRPSSKATIAKAWAAVRQPVSVTALGGPTP
jgi:hypothetical protein